MTEQQKIQRQKTAILVLAVLLALSVAALGGVLLYGQHYLRSISAIVPDNSITTQAAVADVSAQPQPARCAAVYDTGAQPMLLAASSVHAAAPDDEVTLALSSSSPSDNTRFVLPNMFPGDSVTQPYCVTLSWKGTVTVYFRADIYPGCEKLGEVLRCRVVIDDQTRYDGLMRDMPAIGYTCTAYTASSRELDYQITAYLDTSVGNEYQEKRLMADFVWWVSGDEQIPGGIGGGGDDDEGGASGMLPELDKGGHYAYIIGFPDGLIHPEAEITRAETATIFFRLLTEQSRQYYWSRVSPYFDVAADAWYNNAISTLTNAAILNGRPGNTFDPDASISRAEFAAIASRFFADAAVTGGDRFSDIAGHWANEEINRAYQLGLVEGYGDGTFRPDQPISRAEAMTLMNRVLERAPHKDHLLADMITWPDNMDTTAWYYAAVQEATNSHAYVFAADCANETHEIWTDLLPVRDWAALERVWSQYDSSANPGEPTGSMLTGGNMHTVNAGGSSAQLPVTTLRALADGDGSLSVLFSDCSVLFDPRAVTAILDGSGTADVTVQVMSAPGAQLNQAQQNALRSLSVARVVTASVNDGAVSDFGGGLATVYVPFDLSRAGACSYSVVYAADDGTLTYVDSYYLDGYIVFFAEHFSDYVIVRDLDRAALADGKLVSPLWAKGGWLLVAVPAAAAAGYLILRRKGEKHDRQ